MEGQSDLLADKIIEIKLRWNKATKQILASCVSYLVVIQTGICMAYSGILIPQLMSEDTVIKINDAEESWIASLVTLLLPVGALSAGPIMDKFGRKRLCLLNCVPFVLCWFLIAIASNVYYIYIARILAGIGSGWTAVSLVYVSEISHATFRAMLLSFNSVFFSLGILIVCTLGTFMSWRLMAIVFAVMSFLNTLIMLVIPESPHWFIAFRNMDRVSALKSLNWLYEDEEISETQLSEVLKSRRNITNKDEETTSTNLIKTLMNPSVFKPSVTLLIIFLLQQCTGSYVMIFYIIDVFKKIGNNLEATFNEYTCLILLGFIRFFMSIISSIVSKRVGRKTLMYTSCIGMIISSFFIAVKKSYFDSSNDLLSAIFVLIYLTFASLGVLVIPWTLVTEILPIKLKGKLGGILITYTYLIMFIFVKIFPQIMKNVEIAGIFSFFGTSCLLLIIFISLYLPETFSKTFLEIETYYYETKMFCR